LLKNIDFNRLKVFYFIYTSGSIADAAKELRITGSAVSQHLKKLEQEVQSHLFTRLHKKLVPTPDGDRLYVIVRPFFADLTNGLLAMKHGRQVPSGELRVGAPIEFGNCYVPPVMAAFRRLYAEVVFTLRLGSSETLINLVRAGELDFTIVDFFTAPEEYPGSLGDLHIVPVIDEEIILVGSKDYVDDVLGGDFSIGNLLTREFIAYRHNILVLKSWFRHHYGKKITHLNIVLTVDNVRAIISGVKNGIGLGVVPSHVVYDELLRGEIVPIPTAGKNAVNHMSMVQLQDKIPTLAEKKFKEFLLARLQEVTIRKEANSYSAAGS